MEKPGLLCGLKAKDFFQQWPLLLGQCRCHATCALWVKMEVASQVGLLPRTPQAQTPLENHFSFLGRGKNGWHGLACYTAKVFTGISSSSRERMEIKHIRKSW